MSSIDRLITDGAWSDLVRHREMPDIDGMEEVEGSIPSSSTRRRRSATCGALVFSTNALWEQRWEQRTSPCPIVNSALSEQEGVGDIRQPPLTRQIAPAIRAVLAGLVVGP